MSHGTVGWIGLGTMGSRQAANLRKAGWELVVFNRTRARAEEWAAAHDARVADTPGAVAAAADVVFTMLVDGAQVEDALLGAAGAAHQARPGGLFVDMSTIAPADTRRIGAALAERGVAFVDAPVTGSAPKAEAGTLTIMVGGHAEDVKRVHPLLETMGERIVHVGPPGQGEMAKLINNAVAAVNAAVVAQALLVGQATGVDLDALVEIMSAGSGGSAMLDLKAAPMRAHDFRALFKLAHMLKDVRLCLEEGQAAGVPFPAAGAARELYSAALGRGHAGSDFCAVVEVLEGLAGRRLA